MNEAAKLMWYDNSVLMTFLGVILGAVIGFISSIIQSRINAKNNIEVVNAQSKKEIEQHRYMEKEKLYSELIGFLPQACLAIDAKAKRVQLTNEQIIQLNSFKSRLSIFSTKEIYDEFYDLVVYITEETDHTKVVTRIDSFTETILDDLKKAE